MTKHAPLDEDIEETLYAERGHQLRDLYITGAADLLSRAELETRFLIKDALPEAGVGMLVGRPGDGKSWVAYDLALAVARARPWLIFRNGVRRLDGTARARPVLVLNYDNPEAELGRRFLRMGMTARDPIHFHSLASVTPPSGLPAILRLPQAFEGLLMIIESIRPGLILIDSLRQAHTLEESGSRDMGVIAACLRQMTQFGASVLAIHHLRKKGGDKEKERNLNTDLDLDEAIRGSGELVASADVTMHIAMTDKLSGEVRGALKIAKTRGWTPSIAECDYKIRDSGDTTLVEPGGRLDVVLGNIKKHGPITRRDLQRKIGGLTAEKLRELINLCIDFGKVKEISRQGETRALVIVDPKEQSAERDV